MKKTKSIPRGIRNNNPLNIERGRNRWVGMRKEQNDPRFLQFLSMSWGIRAGFRILQTYQLRYNLWTLRQIINRWCPPTEKGNLTDQYVNYVAMKSGISPDEVLPPVWSKEDRELWVTIVSRMILMECGQPVDCKTIQVGWLLAFQKKK